MSASNTAIASAPAVLPAGSIPVHPGFAQRKNSQSSLGFAQVVTLVLWTGCLTVGGLGFALAYTRPHAPAKDPAPVVVEKIVVELTPDLPPAPTAAPADPTDAPPPPSALEQPAPAQPVAVAEPSTVAFALPVEGPVTLVDPSRAAHRRPAVAPVAAAGTGLPSPEQLVFGQGEGRQPAPVYPARAVKARQQGTVGVRLTVNPEGNVLDAAVAAPSPWPMLDQAAVRTVRHRWHFPRGRIRVYEVAIRFALAE